MCWSADETTLMCYLSTLIYKVLHVYVTNIKAKVCVFIKKQTLFQSRHCFPICNKGMLKAHSDTANLIFLISFYGYRLNSFNNK